MLSIRNITISRYANCYAGEALYVHSSICGCMCAYLSSPQMSLFSPLYHDDPLNSCVGTGYNDTSSHLLCIVDYTVLYIIYIIFN